MTETETPDVSQADVAPTEHVEPSEHLEAQNLDQPNEGQEEVGQPQEDPKEANFKALRDQMQVMKEHNERLARENEEFKQALFNGLKPSQEKAPPAPEPEEEDDLDENDWTTKKHTQRIASKEAKAIIEQALAQERERRLKEELPDRLKKDFADFDSVVTKENVDYLKANKPHLAATLAATKDPYAQAAAAYEMIKATCPGAQKTPDQVKAEKNASKPGTMGSAAGGSPLSQAKMFENGLTPDLKKKLQEEMIAASRAS